MIALLSWSLEELGTQEGETGPNSGQLKNITWQNFLNLELWCNILKEDIYAILLEI